jgi:hypothetical protein
MWMYPDAPTTEVSMTNSQVGTLFVSAARETRDDLQQTAWRLLARATNLAAHASGALAGQVDELGGRLSERLDDVLGTVTARAGDGLVVLGERLSGAHAEHSTGAHPEFPDPVSGEWSPGATRHSRGLTSRDDTYPGN